MSKRVGRAGALKLTALGVAFAAGFGTSSLRSSAMPPSPASAELAVEESEAAELELVGTNVRPPTVTRRVQTSTGSARPARAPAAPASGPLDARSVGRASLEFTVFIRGGGVYGAGVALDDAGHVLTCDHVIDGVNEPELQVFFHGDPRPHAARVLDRDGRLDLALLQIDRGPSTTPRLSSVADTEMGDEVFAMGAPRKMSFSLSRGIVSYVGRSFDGTQHIQTDISANSGSSGGPLLNSRGELVGISSFILRGSQGLAFAIPIDYAFRRFPVLRGGPDGKRFDRWLATRSGPDASRPDFSGKSKRPASR